jgi:hypothetical protein
LKRSTLLIMWITGAESYFDVGKSGLMCVRRANELAFSPSVRRILDLPCGHGRVARYLRACYPDASMSFCDIDRSGVDFCCQTFGGTPVYSQPELTKVDIGADYDIMWVGSLFTHVDRSRTERWLRYLCSHLSERGIMVATFHGPASIEVLDRYQLWGLTDEQQRRVLVSYETSGYGYEPYLNFEGWTMESQSPVYRRSSRSRRRFPGAYCYTLSACGPTIMMF